MIFVVSFVIKVYHSKAAANWSVTNTLLSDYQQEVSSKRIIVEANRAMFSLRSTAE